MGMNKFNVKVTARESSVLPKHEVILLKGLPGSGKTTYAKELQKANPDKYKRVNKDDLRKMLDDSKFSKKNEKFVNGMRDSTIVCALMDGWNVIVDDTNFNPVHEKNIRELCSSFENMIGKIEVRVVLFDTPLGECLKRNSERKDKPPVPEKVIKKMYETYLRSSRRAVVVDKIPGLPDVVLCDLDGTVALHNGRSPYASELCASDILNVPIHNILMGAVAQGNKIVFATGRNKKAAKETIQWLADNLDTSVLQNTITVLMRPADDQRPDFVVKKEMYEKHIKGKYNVSFVLDDRDQVVKLWRELGLTCLQVADGNF